MRNRTHSMLLGLATLGAAALLVALGGEPAVSGGNLHLDLQVPGGPRSAAIPADCSTWHELYPAFCVPHHQDAYEDEDGDGMISPCDNIVLDGATWHIIWVGPTYFMTCLQDGRQVVYEPTGDPGPIPLCETWHQIHPVFCEQGHVDDWIDADGSGDLSVCDEVILNGLIYHIDEIGLDIIIEPGPTDVDEDAWSRIKAFFR